MRKTLKRAIVLITQQCGIELFALHCLHELQNKRFVRKSFESLQVHGSLYCFSEEHRLLGAAVLSSVLSTHQRPAPHIV